MAETSLVVDDPLKLREEIIGLKFKPSDETLVIDYLGGKVSGRNSSIWQHIKEVDLYKFRPTRLRRLACDLDKRKMYFFVQVRRKFGNGRNIDRVTPDGCWKKTGKPSDVKDRNGNPIATKTCLAYYKYDQNSVKEEIKTQWLMTEYMLHESRNDKNSKTMQTLCIVYLHDREKRKECASGNESYDKGSEQMSFVVEPCPPPATTPVAPPTQNSSFDCSQQNLNNHHDFSRAWKRHCPSNVHEKVPIMDNAFRRDPPFNPSSSTLEELYTPTFSPGCFDAILPVSQDDWPSDPHERVSIIDTDSCFNWQNFVSDQDLDFEDISVLAQESDPYELVSIRDDASCFDPAFNSSSEPVYTLEGLYTPTISPQNMQNPLSGSSEAAAEYPTPVVQDYRPDFIPAPYLALESGQCPDPSIICNSYNQQLCTDLQPLHRSDDSDRWQNPSLDAVPSFNTTDEAPPSPDIP